MRNGEISLKTASNQRKLQTSALQNLDVLGSKLDAVNRHAPTFLSRLFP
jgi:hypothetical protein